LLSRAIGAINGVGDVLDIANKFKNSGISYKFGANDVNNKKLDCSSFTQNVFAQAGYSIGRTTKDQVKNTKAVALKDAVPGDLVFFQGTYLMLGYIWEMVNLCITPAKEKVLLLVA
jgi:cell wall-associated NlpC family hydrolase